MHVLTRCGYCILTIVVPLLSACTDLVVSKATYAPECLEPDTQITFTIEVKNDGFGFLGMGRAGPSQLAFQLGGETVPHTYPVPTLDPGEHHTINRVGVLGSARNYQNTLTVDVNNNVSESHEDNNTTIQYYTVRAPGQCKDQYSLTVLERQPPHQLIRMNPQTGAQTILAESTEPYGWGLAAWDCRLWYATPMELKVFDVGTSVETVLVNSPLLDHPHALAVAQDGTVYVSEHDYPGVGVIGNIFKVDPTTHAMSQVTTGGAFGVISGIAVAPDGTLYALSRDDAKVVRVNTAGGGQTVITSGGNLVEPRAIWVDHDGSLLVASILSSSTTMGNVVRIDPATGTQTMVSSGGTSDTGIAYPQGIVSDHTGKIYVATSRQINHPSEVMRIDPVSGARTTVFSGAYGTFLPIGIGILPDTCFTGG